MANKQQEKNMPRSEDASNPLKKAVRIVSANFQPDTYKNSKDVYKYVQQNEAPSVTQKPDNTLKRAGRTFLTTFQPDVFNNSYVNRAYIDAGIDPYTVQQLIKNPNTINEINLSDFEKNYLRNLLNLPVENTLKQSNKLETKANVNTNDLKALETSVLTKLKLLPKDILPINPGSAGTNTGSTDIGIFDTPNNYTPITPNNAILPNTAIDSNKGTSNTTENVVNVSEGQGLPQNLLPVNLDYGTDTGTKNTLGNSVKKKENQNVKTETKQPVLTPEQIAYDKAINASNALERSAIIGDYYANHGAKKSVDNPKTALSEPQRDYYRYLTGYQRMDPNQAILSMGLDPNKYYY